MPSIWVRSTPPVSWCKGVRSSKRGSLSRGFLVTRGGGSGVDGVAQSSYAVGDLLSADTTTTLSKIAAVASGQVLTSAGTGTIAAYSANPTVTTATASRTALGTTSTDGLIAVNTTAATGGATVQISPRTRLRGTAWDTAASQTPRERGRRRHDWVSPPATFTCGAAMFTWTPGSSRRRTHASERMADR